MKKLIVSTALVLLSLSVPIRAQIYGTSASQNSPAPENGSLFVFDPETLTWIDGIIVSLAGFTTTGITGITVHPNLAPPDDANNGKLGAVVGRVLATIDPATGVATQIGNLGDKFSSISFREDGQLFGATGNGATVPESLFKIDKTNGTKTLVFAMGNGVDGEIIAYNPVDDFFYHWSGNGTLVFEKFSGDALTYTPTNIPTIGTTSGETFGAVYDPCKQYDFGGFFQFGFTTSNINSSFNAFSTGGNVLPAFGVGAPDDIRGLALIGGYTCEADLGVGMTASTPALISGDPLVLDIVVDNAGEARARNPSLSITLPPSLSAATTTGCSEDPNGIPTCTPKIFVQKWTVGVGYAPLQINNLWRGRATTVTVNATYSGGGGNVVAETTSLTTETVPADNTASYILGDVLFKNSFEN
jgi:Domain of unknown function DUF11